MLEYLFLILGIFITSKDQISGKYGYIGNWILRIYRNIDKISVDIFRKISEKEKII